MNLPLNQQKLRVAMLTACYKPVINGITRMIESYKSNLEEQGHEVFVLTFSDRKASRSDEDRIICSPGLRLGNSGYFVGPRYKTEAQEVLATADIIHCHHLFMSINFANRYGRCPIVYTNHTRNDIYASTYLHIPPILANKLSSYFWPKMTDMVDVVIAPSRGVRDIMLNYGVRVPIVVIENGIQWEDFYSPSTPLTKSSLGIPEDELLLTYVGRISPEKNLKALLEQFSLALNLVPNLHLMVIGDGPSLGLITQHSENMGISNRVHFTGSLKYSDVANYLAAADLFITASTSEVHPLTVMEAMAAGLPTIAVSSPGISEIVISGFNGYIVNSSEEIHSAIFLICKDPLLRSKMAHNAKASSRKFDIRQNIRQTLELYKQLLESQPIKT